MKVRYNKLNVKPSYSSGLSDAQLERLVAMARLIAVLNTIDECRDATNKTRAECLDTFIIAAREILEIKP